MKFLKFAPASPDAAGPQHHGFDSRVGFGPTQQLPQIGYGKRRFFLEERQRKGDGRGFGDLAFQVQNQDAMVFHRGRPIAESDQRESSDHEGQGRHEEARQKTDQELSHSV